MGKGANYMKKGIMGTKGRNSFMILMILIMLIPPAQATLNFYNDDNSIPEAKAWTTLYYIDNDYSGSLTDPLQQVFIDEIASTSNLNVVVIQDKLDEPALLYYINENHTKILLEDLGEVDMADYLTLKNFIEYGKQNYPAEKYLLWIVNHGGAWKGACIDETDNSTAMTMDEFQRALSETGGVDIICFLACLMGSIETVYELRDLVDIVIGSEDLAYTASWNGVCGDTNQLLTNTPDLSLEEIGSKIVNFFSEYTNPYSHKLTMSAIRTDKITPLVDALDQLVRYHTSHWISSYRPVRIAHDSTFLLADFQSWAPVFEIYDLKGYIESLPSSPERTAVLDAFHDAVITEVHGRSMEGTNGLSIFFPAKKSPYNLVQFYKENDQGLDFAADTWWNEFLFFFVVTNTILLKY